MYIINLKIYENFPQRKIIRDIPFKQGMNIVVDKSEKSGNNVGKTTALKLIDICLGAKSKKYIYIDPETRNENTDLKNYITNSKISCMLILAKSFDEKSPKTVLEVELFPNGKRYFNHEQLNEKDYYYSLNKTFFNITDNTPTFRELIGKFVRLNQQAENNKFLKYIDANVRTDLYVSIYNFLFNLVDTDINTIKSKLELALHEDKKNLSSFKKINNITTIDSLVQELNVVLLNISKYRKMIDSLTDSAAFQQTEEEVKEIKVKYTLLSNDVEKLEYEKNRIEAILQKSKDDIREVDYSVLKQLYDEVLSLSEISKEFDELVKFNKQLTFNKLNFYHSELQKKQEQLEIQKTNLRSLFTQHSEIIMLIKQNNIEEYQNLQLKIALESEKSGALKKLISLYEGLQNSIDNKEEELAEIKPDKNQMSNKIGNFNSFFAQYSKDISGEEYLVYLNDQGFPISIKSSIKNDGFGTGSKKALISTFDLAYVSYAKELNIPGPKFIILDVIESVDAGTLEKIVNVVNTIDCQYIVAVLNEKIKNTSNIGKKDKILELSKADRLFKI